jgi:hypothetical protein
MWLAYPSANMQVKLLSDADRVYREDSRSHVTYLQKVEELAGWPTQ